MPKFGALDNSIPGSHTEHEWMDLLAKWNWLCFYCAEPIRRNSADPNHEATKDHMVPISRGGVDFIANIVPACLRCNQLKGNKTVDEFRAERAWVKAEKSTGITRYAAPSGNSQQINTPENLPTVEVAAMWKRVLDTIPKKQFPDNHTDDWYVQRKAVLKAQAESIARRRLENAGQLTLPIFGDGSPRKLMETEPQALTVAKGMHVTDAPRRQA
jgi:HNH endonuclease